MCGCEKGVGCVEWRPKEGRKQRTFTIVHSFTFTMGKPKRKHESDSDDGTKPDIRGSAPAKAKPWTGAEQRLLLKLVLEKGTTEAFKFVPGRTYNQCRMAWR